MKTLNICVFFFSVVFFFFFFVFFFLEKSEQISLLLVKNDLYSAMVELYILHLCISTYKSLVRPQ